jgi:hypothetical protein
MTKIARVGASYFRDQESVLINIDSPVPHCVQGCAFVPEKYRVAMAVSGPVSRIQLAKNLCYLQAFEVEKTGACIIGFRVCMRLQLSVQRCRKLLRSDEHDINLSLASLLHPSFGFGLRMLSK